MESGVLNLMHIYEEILKTCSIVLGTLSHALQLFLDPPSTVSGSAREALGMSTKGCR